MRGSSLPGFDKVTSFILAISVLTKISQVKVDVNPLASFAISVMVFLPLAPVPFFNIPEGISR